MRIEEERGYKYRLSAIAGRPCRDICGEDLSQVRLGLSVVYVCLYFLHSDYYFLHHWSHWQQCLAFEHRFYERLLEHTLLFGWQDVEEFAIRPKRRSHSYALTQATNWFSICINRLLLVPRPQVISCISNFFSRWPLSPVHLYLYPFQVW